MQYKRLSDDLYKKEKCPEQYSHQIWKIALIEMIQRERQQDYRRDQQYQHSIRLAESIFYYQECLRDIQKGYTEIKGEFEDTIGPLKLNDSIPFNKIINKFFGSELKTDNQLLTVSQIPIRHQQQRN